MSEAVPDPAAETTVRDDSQPSWFYSVAGQQCGPVTDAQFVQLCASGQITPDTLVWKEGFANWMPFAHLNANIPMAAPGPDAALALTYGKAEEDPTNIFAWWWQVVRHNYGNFRGRARRKEFWSFALVNMLILFGTYLPGAVLSSGRPDPLTHAVGLVFLALAGIIYIGTIMPCISAAVRRLHDSGKSGWLFLLAFVPYIGLIILIIFLTLDSQPDTNQYGPNPKSAIRERM